jgi:hypothetical protein
MGNDNVVFINFYVRTTSTGAKGEITFVVVETATREVFIVTRYGLGAWGCACESHACDHIHRAMLYYNDVLARTKDLKEQLNLRQQIQKQATVDPLAPKKRLIRPQGE